MKPIIKGLGHIGIKCENADAAVKFYTDNLGFEHFYSYDMERAEGVLRLRFVRAGSCILEFIQPADTSGLPDLGEGIIAHVCIEVQGIDTLVEDLKKAGVDSFQTDEIISVPDFFPTGSRLIFFTGPCGETIELYEYAK